MLKNRNYYDEKKENKKRSKWKICFRAQSTRVHTLQPASNLRRHDGRRSVVIVVVAVDVLDDAGIAVFRSFASWAPTSAEYLLASFRNFSASDIELALSMSNNDRLLLLLLILLLPMAALVAALLASVVILSFLSSSVMPSVMTLSCALLPITVAGFVENLRLDWWPVGDTFDSVFSVVVELLSGKVAGTFIVADADVDVVTLCRCNGDGIVNVVTVLSSSAFGGALIVYEATTTSSPFASFSWSDLFVGDADVDVVEFSF